MSNEKNPLFKDCWKKIKELSEGVDLWEFKRYILGFLFYRYISEDFSEWIEKALKESGEDIKYEDVSDDDKRLRERREMMIETKGYFIKPSQLFSSVLKIAKEDENLNQTLTDIFIEIEGTVKDLSFSEQAYSNIKGLLTYLDLNNHQLGDRVDKKNSKLFKIMQTISEIDFSTKQQKTETFGELYEYLIGEYASKVSKKGGKSYTPVGVSELLVQLTISGGQKIKKVYDPACGSGSLLLKFKKFVDNQNMKIYGQDKDLDVCQLCKMNMYLHETNPHKFEIRHGDTLSQDLFTSEKFDAIVSHPTFSAKWEGEENPLLRFDERFRGPGVLAPKSKADMAFIQHSIYHLNETGVAAIVCFPGILFRGGAEKQIRQWLIEKNFIDAVIQLPPNLFYGTGISACIIALKTNTKKDSNILFIDASELFVKVKNRKRLEENNVKQITDYYKNRSSVENYSYLASFDEVAQKDFNLSVSAYVIKKEIKEKVDIVKLKKDIKETTEKIEELRRQIDELIEKLEAD